jgi:hypothetical protein
MEDRPVDDREFAATCVGVAMEQFNERLMAVAEGHGAEPELDEHGVRSVSIAPGETSTRTLLMSGLDVSLEGIDGVAHDLAHALMDEIQAAVQRTGTLECGDIQRALESMFTVGCLHERERARREAASA